MELITLRQTLVNFVENPSESWGQAHGGDLQPIDLTKGFQARVTIEQGDINTARCNSGTYTEEQNADFNLQCSTVERIGYGTAYFSGNPNDLPDTVPERICPCGKKFRSAHTDEDIICYECNLAIMCPMLPGRHIKAYWDHDVWHLTAFGDVGFHNEMTYWWYNRNSHGNTAHQGLVVKRTKEGAIRTIVFSTAAVTANRCYVITFDLEANTTTLSVRKTRYVNAEGCGEPLELDNLVLDFMVAMTPAWMLFEHRPRDPRNGCFA